MSAAKTAILIGNSDGIGLACTRLLLKRGWRVIGVSRSSSPLELEHDRYSHHVIDVTSSEYLTVLQQILEPLKQLDVAIYCAGVGDLLDLKDLSKETRTFEVNTLGGVRATEVVLSRFVAQGYGHFIGLSSVADAIHAPRSPAYGASKAGVSRYWESLGLQFKGSRIHVSNLRFGFVDTKMAKATSKPFLLSAEQAAEKIGSVIERPRIRVTRPRRLVPLLWALGLMTRIRLNFA